MVVWLRDLRVLRGEILMKVRVQFYAQLRDQIGMRELDIELVEGATVRDLLEKVYAQQPALRRIVKGFWLGEAVDLVTAITRLRQAEELALCPPFKADARWRRRAG